MTVAHRLARAVALATALSVPVVALAFAVRVGWRSLVEADTSAIRWATDLTREREASRSLEQRLRDLEEQHCQAKPAG